MRAVTKFNCGWERQGGWGRKWGSEQGRRKDVPTEGKGPTERRWRWALSRKQECRSATCQCRSYPHLCCEWLNRQHWWWERSHHGAGGVDTTSPLYQELFSSSEMSWSLGFCAWKRWDEEGSDVLMNGLAVPSLVKWNAATWAYK